MGGLFNKNGDKISNESKYKELDNYLSGEGLDRMLYLMQNSTDIQFMQLYLRLLPFFKAQKKAKNNLPKGKGNRTINIELPNNPNLIDIIDEVLPNNGETTNNNE